ncbi:MAG: hypothetical protein ACLFQE_06660 [Thermotogota bacterium]
MKKTKTLKQCLEGLSKEELVDLGKNQGLDSPEKLKKTHLVKHLNQMIPSKFEEAFNYLTPDELKVFTGEHPEIVGNAHFKIRKAESEYDDDDFSIPDLLEDMEAGLPMDDFFDALDEVQEEMFSNTPEWLAYLLNNGFVFSIEDEQSPLQVPSDIYDIYIKKMKEKLEQDLDYQSLQRVLFASVNLYGCCPYEHLQKLFTQQTGSDASLENIKEYVLQFAEKRQKLNANDNYFYHKILKVEDLVPLINSDVESYYLPSQDEMNTYSNQLIGPQANEIYKALKELIITKTKIEETLTGMLIGYEDAIEEDAIDILFDYEEILDYLPYCLKMGKNLNYFLEKFDKLSIRFNSALDEEKAKSMYVKLLKKTRKWTLKGALESEF